jgi:predicted nucleotidyltransferase
LTPEFREFLQLLNERQVSYLIVGGFAVIAHGYVRSTKDIDLWVDLDPAVDRQILDVIEEFFGVRPPDGTFLRPGKIFRMGNYPNAIEILTRLPGVDFGECLERSISVEVDGLQLPLISLADLRVNKAACGRPQDLGDLDNLPPAN